MNGEQEKKMKNWVRMVIILSITGLACLHPISRQIVIWILPLGIGMPDLIGTGLLLAALIILGLKSGYIIKKFSKWIKK